MSVQTVLKRVAEEYKDYLYKYLESRNYPKGDLTRGLKPIQDTIEVGQVVPTDYGYKVEVSIGGPEAPYTLAFEYGSGVHSTRGAAGKYPIKGNPLLAFYWEKVGKFVVLPVVSHPGIEAVPFVEPSLKSFFNERVKHLIAKDFKDTIWFGRPKVVRI